MDLASAKITKLSAMPNLRALVGWNMMYCPYSEEVSRRRLNYSYYKWQTRTPLEKSIIFWDTRPQYQFLSR